MHENMKITHKSPIKADGEVWWNQPAKCNECNTASARLPWGDNYSHKTIMPVANKREEEWFANKSCNLPTRAPRGGVLLLITLRVSSKEATSAAEQYPWRLGWPKVSYIVSHSLCTWNFLKKERKPLGLQEACSLYKLNDMYFNIHIHVHIYKYICIYSFSTSQNRGESISFQHSSSLSFRRGRGRILRLLPQFFSIPFICISFCRVHFVHSPKKRKILLFHSFLL